MFDARPADKDVSGDPRTLALSLGTVQELQRMGVTGTPFGPGPPPPFAKYMCKQQPTVLWPGQGQAEVCITAAEQRVPQLGAVVSYGTRCPAATSLGKPPVPNARNT